MAKSVDAVDLAIRVFLGFFRLGGSAVAESSFLGFPVPSLPQVISYGIVWGRSKVASLKGSTYWVQFQHLTFARFAER